MLTPKGSKERLLEIFQRVVPNFKQPQELQEAPYQQYSDRDAMRVEKKMIEEYGETYNPRIAGFITISGHMIDFSGGGGNTRGIDHRNVGYILDELGIGIGKYSGEDWKNSERVGMYAVMDMGMIRFIPESWGFNMHKMPSQEQFEQLRELLGQKNGRCILDLEDGEDKVHVEHESGTDVSFVFDGIKNFYRYGDKPRSYNDYEEDQDLMENYISEILGNSKPIYLMPSSGKEYADTNIDDVDRQAFGFAADDIKTIDPKKLNVKYKIDFENVIYQQEHSGLNKVAWAKTVDLSEPIQLSYQNGKFWIEDGHHRYYAALILGKNLNVDDVEIKDKPHYTAVKNALIAGKKVPNEVLREYPDLLQKYGNLNKNTINEIHNINDFKFNKTKNIVQRYVESGSIPTEFIEPNRYFIIGLDYMNGVISVSTTLSKQTCLETQEYLKSNGNVQQILVEKPEVGAQSMSRHDKWKPKNIVYGNENQTKLDLKEVLIVDLDYKRTIF